jgi:glucose-1-phosphate thymidylyltransferase
MKTQIKKGIILAAGKGSRLYPSTLAVSKQLLPVWDKPMIYYPLSMLMLAGIKDVLIIVSPENIDQFKLLGDGKNLGINIRYEIQPSPAGISECLLHINDFIIGDEPFCLLLGDNIFYGKINWFSDVITNYKIPTVFGYPVEDPSRYGVATLDSNGNVVSIEEKPKNSSSKLAIPGVYILDGTCLDFIRNEQKPSDRGEYEITDVMLWFLKQNKLDLQEIGLGVTWFDTGTPESLLECSEFIRTVEKNHGMKIGCIEEIALKKDYVTLDEYYKTINELPKSAYRTYLEKIYYRRTLNQILD